MLCTILDTFLCVNYLFSLWIPYAYMLTFTRLAQLDVPSSLEYFVVHIMNEIVHKCYMHVYLPIYIYKGGLKKLLIK